MGRPKIENSKSKQISVRLDNETFEKLEECSKTLNLTRVEVLRKGVDKIFSDIKKQDIESPTKGNNILLLTRSIF